MIPKSIFLVLLGSIFSFLYPQAKSSTFEEGLDAYLFVYFTGNEIANESIHYAISLDGYHYYAVNDNNPILDSKYISSSGGVRDPHIMRCEDGKSFYMVATDMASSKGWNSNRAIVLMKSNNLIDWESSVLNIPTKYKGYDDLKSVWAPQTIFDPSLKKYMIYFSMKRGNDVDVVYKAYANKNFDDIEDEPIPLFRPQSGAYVIDPDIVLKDSLYYLFYKTGDGKFDGIKVSTSKQLKSNTWTEFNSFLQPTRASAEGPCVFKLNHSDDYILMCDLFRNHSFQFSHTTDLHHFSQTGSVVELNFHPRHGTVIPIKKTELDVIVKKWGIPKGLIAKYTNNMNVRCL